jgi:predicted HTH transcriptional regulator
VYLELLVTDAEATHLAVTGDVGSEKRSDIQKRVLDLLAENGVLTRAKLRETLSVKNERLGDALESLQQAGRISRTPTGWQRTN